LRKCRGDDGGIGDFDAGFGIALRPLGRCETGWPCLLNEEFALVVDGEELFESEVRLRRRVVDTGMRDREGDFGRAVFVEEGVVGEAVSLAWDMESRSFVDGAERFSPISLRDRRWLIGGLEMVLT
jgi:hypothetical protein